MNTRPRRAVACQLAVGSAGKSRAVSVSTAAIGAEALLLDTGRGGVLLERARARRELRQR